LKSWLKFNDIDLKFDVKIKGEYETPRVANEKVPSKEELSRIIRKASSRGMVIIALMAFSRLRPESLENCDSDGLHLGDLKDLKRSEKIQFEKISLTLLVKSNFGKQGIIISHS
jgi:hypothetical protein